VENAGFINCCAPQTFLHGFVIKWWHTKSIILSMNCWLSWCELIAKIICWWQVLSLTDLPIKLMEKIGSWFRVY
jgi:hypothetical protein